MTYIDEHAPDFAEQLASIHDIRPQHCNTYLLIDGVFDPRWFAYLKGQTGLAWRALLASIPGASEESLQVSPLLVHYVLGDREVESLLRASSGKPMLSMLTTPEDVELFSARLAPWCIVEADGQHFNFRFADTRRLPGIVAVLDARQHGQFLGPACTAHYVNRQGHWEVLPLPPQPEPPAERVKLKDEQFAALVADSEADEMLATLAYPPLLADEPLMPSQRHDRARLALLQAKRYSEENASERLALCRLTLEFPQWESDAACVEHALKSGTEDTDRWEHIAQQLRERIAA